MKLTPQQKEVVEQMKAKDLMIRYVVSYGRLDAYFYNAPVFTRVDLRVFDSLRSKGLIEEDGSAEYWRLSPKAVGNEVNMSNTKHTPGPWIHYHGKLRPQFPNLIHEIQEEKNGVAIVKWGGFDGVDLPKKQIAANARLMAAAPDLLQACEAAYAALGFPIDDESLNRVTNQLATAIGKAKR